MSYYTNILVDGLLLSFLASLWLTLALWVNPRIFLHDYPPEIQERVPPKSKSEKRLSYVFGIPFMILLLVGTFLSTQAIKEQGNAPFWALWVNATGVLWVFNIVDWLILDWLMFCTITPRFVVIPGSEGMAEYKDYRFHFRGFLHGTVYSIIGGLLISGVVFILE